MASMRDESGRRHRIPSLRTTLLAEHLDITPEQVQQAVEAAKGSLITAIETLRGGGRSLAPFVPPDFGPVVDEVLRENDLLDPERPSHRLRFFR